MLEWSLGVFVGRYEMNSQEKVIISYTYLLPSKTAQYSSSQTKHTLMCFQTIFPPQGKREFPMKHHPSG